MPGSDVRSWAERECRAGGPAGRARVCWPPHVCPIRQLAQRARCLRHARCLRPQQALRLQPQPVSSLVAPAQASCALRPREIRTARSRASPKRIDRHSLPHASAMPAGGLKQRTLESFVRVPPANHGVSSDAPLGQDSPTASLVVDASQETSVPFEAAELAAPVVPDNPPASMEDFEETACWGEMQTPPPEGSLPPPEADDHNDLDGVSLQQFLEGLPETDDHNDLEGMESLASARSDVNAENGAHDASDHDPFTVHADGTMVSADLEPPPDSEAPQHG